VSATLHDFFEIEFRYESEMFSSLKRLLPQVATRQPDHSVFSYISRAGLELSSSQQPVDLEGLVRIASAVQSFRYPAFNAAMSKTLLRGGDKEWIERLVSDAEQFTPAKALRCLKTLCSLDIPRELQLVLLRKVSINSRQDIDEFLSAFGRIDPARISGDVRTSLHYAVKNAVKGNCRLGTYNTVLDLVNRVWESSQRHLLQTRMRQDVVASGWTAFLSLDMAKEEDFVEAVKWLSHGEPAVGRKEDVDLMLSRVETRAKGYISHERLAPMISAILKNCRKPIVAEPLDSIAQLMVKKINVSRVGVSELIDLVEALISFSSASTRAVQLDSVVSQILPGTVESLVKNLTLIPSRALPGALRLLGAAESHASILEDCLRDRGHEMDGVELVRLATFFSDSISRETIKRLFACRLGEETNYLTNLLNRLELKDKLEFLAVVSAVDPASILVSSLIESIKSSVDLESDLNALHAETVVKMFSAGDAVFRDTGIVPSELLRKFLESENSGVLSLYHSLQLLRATTDVSISKALFEHVTKTETLSVFDALELLNAASSVIREPDFVERALRLVVVAMGGRDKHAIEKILKAVPSQILRQDKNHLPKYSPFAQVQCVALEQVDAQISEGTLSAEAAIECVNELARLEYNGNLSVSQSLVDYVRTQMRAVATPISAEQCLALVRSLRKLRIYSGELLDTVSEKFLMQAKGEQVADFAAALIDMGNKNEAVMRACESVLKSEPENISLKISVLNSMAKAGVFSPVFHDQIHRVSDAAAANVSLLSDADWIGFFQINLVLQVEAPPRVKAKYANDVRLKNFFQDHCSFSWYNWQETLRSQFIHSQVREQLAETAFSLGWELRVPDLAQEVYHIDMVSSSGEKLALISVPECDELLARGDVRVIVGSSLSKIKHLQLFGYRVVPVWMAEWKNLDSLQLRKDCLLRSSSQVVFTLGGGQ